MSTEERAPKRRYVCHPDGYMQSSKNGDFVEALEYFTLASDYDALAARVARLEEALKQAAEDLQLVGDDYPGSSCHKWCSESAATARAALADGEKQA